MLYDQGQLAVVYSKAYLLEKNQLFADTLNGILSYVSRDLSHPVSIYFYHYSNLLSDLYNISFDKIFKQTKYIAK